MVSERRSEGVGLCASPLADVDHNAEISGCFYLCVCLRLRKTGKSSPPPRVYS